MSSPVTICNLALSHIGDTATVASIDPPEGSVQADLCARFYPVALASMMEAHPWSWALRRAVLAPLGSAWPQWQYAYALPADALSVVAVLPSTATDDHLLCGAAVPVPWSQEINDTGQQCIYTNQPDAVCRYVAMATDASRFSATFVMALSYHLAALLAGPIIKGRAGAEEATRCLSLAAAFQARAAAADANQGPTPLNYLAAFIGAR